MIDRHWDYKRNPQEASTALRGAVEKALGRPLTDAKWQKVEPKSYPPYGEEDYQEVWRKLKRERSRIKAERNRKAMKAVRDKVTETIINLIQQGDPHALKRLKSDPQALESVIGDLPALERAKISVLSRWDGKTPPNWDSDYIAGREPEEHLNNLRGEWLPEVFRGLGIERVYPVPLDKLKETLIELGGTEQPGPFPLPYPVCYPAGFFHSGPPLFPIGNLDFPPIKIGTVYAKSNTVLAAIAEGVYRLEVVFRHRYHAAEIVALMFCNLTPWVSNFKVYREGNQVVIRVFYPGVKPSSIAKAYASARGGIFKELRGGKDTGKRPKPKERSERTETFLEFCKTEERAKSSWEVRLQKWNREYPKWPYRNVHSMAVFYHRVKKWEI